MAGPDLGVGGAAADVNAEKNEKIKKLVNRLIDDTNLGYAFETPITEYGYLQLPSNGSSGANFEMREDVISARKSLLDTVNDEKGNRLPAYADYKAQIDAIENAYKDLHKIQKNYIDGLLRGNDPDVAKFKQDQKDKIDACNKALKKLVDEAKFPPLSPEKTKLNASLDTQKTLLDTLPSKIEKDRDHLLQKLENHRQRNLSERADQEIHQESQNTLRHDLYIKSKMFSLYRERGVDYREKEKQIEKDIGLRKRTKQSPDDDPEAVVEAGKSKKQDLYKGYVEAKKIITDEIALANKPPYKESWFSPFGINEEYVNFQIHRYRKDNKWYLEPKMLRDHQINTTQDFRRMIQTIFDFQRFAGCEKDSITLSYDSPVYGRDYTDKRVDQILETINLLKERAKEPKDPKDPKKPREIDYTKVKTLSLDENSWAALGSGSNPKKIQQIKDGLKELEKWAEKRDELLAKKASKELYDPKDTNGAKILLTDQITKLPEMKELKDLKNADGSQAVDIKDSDSDLHNKLTKLEEKPEEKGIFMAGGVVRPVEALIQVANGATDAEKKDAVGKAYEDEYKEINKLAFLLDGTQKIMEDQLDKLSKIEDYADPAYKDLEDNLVKLQEKEKVLHAVLSERCDKWLQPDVARDINGLGAPRNNYISIDSYNKFKETIEFRKDALDKMGIALDKNKDKIEKITKSIADEQSKETKNIAGLR